MTSIAICDPWHSAISKRTSVWSFVPGSPDVRVDPCSYDDGPEAQCQGLAAPDTPAPGRRGGLRAGPQTPARGPQTRGIAFGGPSPGRAIDSSARLSSPSSDGRELLECREIRGRSGDPRPFPSGGAEGIQGERGLVSPWSRRRAIQGVTLNVARRDAHNLPFATAIALDSFSPGCLVAHPENAISPSQILPRTPEYWHTGGGEAH
jgi:hypothetical protein